MQTPTDFETESLDTFLELEAMDPVSSITSSWIQQAAIRSALRSGNEPLAVSFAISTGVRDENKLTDLVFYTRYPQQQGKQLARGDPLVQRWREIRDRVVRPTLQAPTPVTAPTPSTTSPAPGSAPLGPLGTLTVSSPQQYRFTYTFTREDVLWTGRFIVGEAGGRDDADNRAVIWAMFNRYAFFTYTVYPTFHQFIRAYSTPLQPSLNSWGAAQRHMGKPEFVRTGGYYAPPHDNIPRGQLRQFLQLQARPWDLLPAGARSLAQQALAGHIPNPIGNASEFGSTYVYYHDNYHRYPTDDEWRRYTEAYARSKNWRWIGLTPGLNQKKNAFFIQERIAQLPPDTVRVISP